MEPTLVWSTPEPMRPDCRYVVIFTDSNGQQRGAFRDTLDDALEFHWFHRDSTLFLNGAAIPNETIVAKGKVKARKASKMN